MVDGRRIGLSPSTIDHQPSTINHQPSTIAHRPSMLTIIHTNDFHGRLTEAEAERLAGLRAEHAGALLLDSGDAVSAGNLGCRIGGEPILAAMSDLGYDAMTMGN